MSARTKARRRALDVLFEADVKGVGDNPVHLRALAAERGNAMVAQVTLPPYSARIVEGVAEHLRDIDEALTSVARGWTLARMPAVDRAALRIGTWEIWFNDEVETGITLDEVVTIVADLSTDESPRFVNGVLGAIAKLPPPSMAPEPAPAYAAATGALDETSAPDATSAPDGISAPEETDAPDETSTGDNASVPVAEQPAPSTDAGHEQ